MTIYLNLGINSNDSNNSSSLINLLMSTTLVHDYNVAASRSFEGLLLLLHAYVTGDHSCRHEDDKC